MGIQKILNAEAHYGVPVKIFTNDIDSESIEQLRTYALTCKFLQKGRD
jgi:tRNA-splicing ligase RtcB